MLRLRWLSEKPISKKSLPKQEKREHQAARLVLQGRAVSKPEQRPVLVPVATITNSRQRASVGGIFQIGPNLQVQLSFKGGLPATEELLSSSYRSFDLGLSYHEFMNFFTVRACTAVVSVVPTKLPSLSFRPALLYQGFIGFSGLVIDVYSASEAANAAAAGMAIAYAASNRANDLRMIAAPVKLFEPCDTRFLLIFRQYAVRSSKNDHRKIKFPSQTRMR